ncbi:MAG: GAF domain-containing protein [Actinomycetota bacterium]|nr:GAF domain-containing protein [Actinomycetota bacterium]
MSEVEEPLEALLRRVLIRVEGVVAAEGRVRSLLDAVTAIAGNLDVRQTLERIVAAAADLAGARYVALGVIDQERDGLSEFITYGINEQDAAKIGPLPAGLGILGLIISEPRPLRLHDLRQHPRSYGFPENHPPMSSFLGVPVRVGDRVFGNLYLTDKHGGGDFTDEDEHAVVALAAAAGVAVENARLFATVHRREQWLDATLQIQQAFLRRVDLDTALSLVTAKARDVLEADVAMVVLEQDDGALRVRALEGEPADLLGSTLPREGALADVVEHAATVRLAEGLRMPGLDSVASALLVPFTGPGDHGGALLVGTMTSRRGRWLAEDDVQALQGFAAQAAIAMDRAQAQQDRAALAVLADRDRIARDLHDVVIQRLFATGLMLQSTVRRSSQPDVIERLRGTVADLDTTIRDIRGTIFQLSGSNRANDLREQVRDVAADAHPALGLHPHLVLEGPLDSMVPDELRPDLVAVLVESLSNAARHASPSRVDVRVAIEGQGAEARVVVEVRDDGKGCAGPSHESGLRNMRQRAEARGGAFEFLSSPGGGTLVRWWAPLTDRL